MGDDGRHGRADGEPAAEPPDETTEYRDDVRCGSGPEHEVTQDVKHHQELPELQTRSWPPALEEYKELAVRSGRPDAEGGSREDTDPASSADRQLGEIRGAKDWSQTDTPSKAQSTPDQSTTEPGEVTTHKSVSSGTATKSEDSSFLYRPTAERENV